VILAVPAQEAQPLAELLYAHGVRGMVNFAPVHLRIPEDAFVEQIDLTMALDKAAFFARSKGEHKEMKS
jgi:redox-sensing transcriptional repressor